MQIDPTRRRSSESEMGEEPLSTVRDADASPHVGRAHETLLDGNAALYAQNAARRESVANPVANPGASGGAPRFDDRVLYVGMSSTPGVSTHVAQNVLEAKNLPGAEIVAHAEDGADGADHVRVGGQVVDLATPAGAKAFADSLGLPRARADAIAAALLGASPGSRDELAGIASVWARAERGESIPSRLVLSGHCGGTSVYDGASKDGALTFASVHALADAMPAAAAQIEDVMLSACSTGFDDHSGRTDLSAWKDHFPNLKTAWGYDSDRDYHSPTESHAVAHIAAWSRATAGRAEHVDGPRAVRDTYRALPGNPAPFGSGNVAVWTRTDGYRKGH